MLHSGLVRVIHEIISVRWYVQDHLWLDDFYGSSNWEIIHKDYPCEMISSRWYIIDDPCCMIYDGSSKIIYVRRDDFNGWQTLFADHLCVDDLPYTLYDLAEMIHVRSFSMDHPRLDDPRIDHPQKAFRHGWSRTYHIIWQRWLGPCMTLTNLPCFLHKVLPKPSTC